MYYFYSVLCNRIRHNCCYCFWLIIQIMYVRANRVFPFSKCSGGGGGTILIMCTQCTLQHFIHAMYFRCYNNYIIEENDNYKVMFSSNFPSPNVLLLFVFKIAKWNVFFFLRNCVVYLVIMLILRGTSFALMIFCIRVTRGIVSVLVWCIFQTK